MGNVYYKMGFAVGQKTAQDCCKELLSLNEGTLPLNAGNKLESLRKKETGFCMREDWGCGFFDGYLDWASLFMGFNKKI